MKKVSILTLTTLVLMTLNLACTKKDNPPQTQNQDAQTMLTTPGGGADLKIEDVVVGTGSEAVQGKTVSVHYTGWLTDGKKFDSSVPPKPPFKFKLGIGQVIPGWDKGVAGMKVGGKRKLTIPPELAYGQRGAGNVIPPNSTLLFDVELVNVE